MESFEVLSSPTTTYFLLSNDHYSFFTLSPHRYSLYQIRANIQMDTGMFLSDEDLSNLLHNEYSRLDNSVFFRDDDGNRKLDLTFSTVEQATVFLAHAELQNRKWSGE